MKPKIKHAEKIIIALDVPEKNQALDLVKKLKHVQTFKIGLELFTAQGPLIIQELHKLNKRVFLDLKLHDIPHTVAGAIRSGFNLGVSMMTLHASGGLTMMRRAAQEARELSEKAGNHNIWVLAVTVLTSLKQQELEQIGIRGKTNDQVLNLARLAKKAGMDGLVCSPKETELIRREIGQDLLIINPGVRPLWAAKDDQKRFTTPRQAVRNGADYLVIGRPVTQASDPEKAFFRICQELDGS